MPEPRDGRFGGPSESAMEFCAVCGIPRGEHPPPPPPGPPTPPPEHHEGVWRPSHEFTPSGLTFEEVLEERDAQIDHWRRRAHRAERKIESIRQQVGLSDA